MDQDGPDMTRHDQTLQTEALFFLAALLALFTDVLAYDDNLTGNSSEAAFVSLGLCLYSSQLTLLMVCTDTACSSNEAAMKQQSPVFECRMLTLRCAVPESYSRESLKKLIELNCAKAG